MLKIRLLTDPLFKEKQTKTGLYDVLSRTHFPETRASERLHKIGKDDTTQILPSYMSDKQIFVSVTSFRY